MRHVDKTAQIIVNSDSSEVCVALKIVLRPEKKNQITPPIKVYPLLVGQRTA